MQPHPITIKDIAKKFNCSPSTVSRALNNHPLINEETRKNIQEYAAKMNYQRNTLSLGFRQNKSGTVGVILPHIGLYHETSIVEGLQSVLQQEGYFINICVSNESYELEKTYVEKLLANRAEAIFLSVAQETADSGHYTHLDEIIKRNVPLVFIDREYEGAEASSITIDDYHGAYLATNHLIDVGCKNIAHLKGPQGLIISDMRLQGYLDCLRDHDLDQNDDMIVTTNFKAESASSPMRKLLSLKIIPDGIFGVNDYVCIAAMQVIRDHHISIPDQLKIIGFDNSPFAAFTSPSLSSVNRSGKKMGEEAARLFLRSINTEESQQDKIVLQPNLVIRNSTLK